MRERNYTAQKVLSIIQEQEIKFVKFWFVDILGQVKSFSVMPDEMETAFEDGMGFDGSSIEGFARIYESDLICKPDPTTFAILPWRSGENCRVARVYCDILMPSGEAYDGDPRYVLRKNLAEMKSAGFDSFNVGPELEYFYFRNGKRPEIMDQGGYFDLMPLDLGHDLRRDTILVLQKMGIPVEYSHHEVAPSQHEIDLRYGSALEMADDVISYKVAVKAVAMLAGVYASFMPKPLYGENGSGMHVHMSLFREGRNIFYEEGAPFHLSEDARYFTAGIMRHAREICAITNQWVNSYKRLVPGYEAPVYIVWGQKNRSALVRVPMYKPGKENATRIELRFPDPACNPYLAFSVMLAAGLEGIKNRYPLDDPTEIDVFKLSENERSRMGIEMLPGSLIEAIQEAEKSEFLRKALGEHVFSKFIENKKIEWDDYRTRVTNYELDKYLPIL